MINKGAEEAINTCISYGGALHLTINAGYGQILLVEQRLGHAAVAATLEGQ